MEEVILKLISLTTTLTNTFLLVLMLALGSQNLNTKHAINLGTTRTEKFPSGFLIGMSIVMGSFSGGVTSILVLPSKKKRY